MESATAAASVRGNATPIVSDRVAASEREKPSAARVLSVIDTDSEDPEPSTMAIASTKLAVSVGITPRTAAKDSVSVALSDRDSPMAAVPASDRLGLAVDPIPSARAMESATLVLMEAGAFGSGISIRLATSPNGRVRAFIMDSIRVSDSEWVCR